MFGEIDPGFVFVPLELQLHASHRLNESYTNVYTFEARPNEKL